MGDHVDIEFHAPRSGLSAEMAAVLTPLARGLINRCQHDFPRTPRPFFDLAKEFGVSEAEVLATFRDLEERGILSRIGAVVNAGRLGSSTLAAMAVPADRLEEVAAVISGYAEVNHNYEREGELNLWFVVVAPTRARRDAVIEEIQRVTGIPVSRLPLVEPYHIDLGFPL